LTRFRVCIPTTEGPSEIQRITAEDPDVRSVVCLDGKALALPISAAYDSYVRQPTGVIEKQFGHAAYRVDVSAPITEGLSWQLGLFVAHALDSRGRLARKGEPADALLLLTGEVDRDLNVRPVDHVSEKRRVCGGLFEWATANDQTVRFFVPQANRAELIGDVPGVEIVPVDTVDQVLEALEVVPVVSASAAGPDPDGNWTIRAAAAGGGAEGGGVAAAVTAPVPSARKPAARAGRSLHRWLAAALVLLIAVGAAGWWVKQLGLFEWQRLAAAGAFMALDARLAAVEEGTCAPCRWVAAAYAETLSPAAPDPADLSFSARELRVPRFRTCRMAELRPDLVEQMEVSVNADGGFVPSKGADLCAMEYRITNRGAPVHGVLVIVPRFADAALLQRMVFPEPAPLAAQATMTAQLSLPARLQERLELRLIGVSGNAPLGQQRDWLRRQIEETARGRMSPERFRRRLARVGLAVSESRHVIEPAPPRFQ